MSDGVPSELDDEPVFRFGEKVRSRKTIRNDGTYVGKEIGEILVRKGDLGYVSHIGTFLQQFYIYGVDFLETGHRVGMKAKELVSLDRLPEADAKLAPADENGR
ncbi:nitrogen fixation protein NifZ [Candidatus Macondimonas diazotrophica]|jgi:nitrogen fixation protein NifZ|uniref:Nitrogen fixation protein NifZ n=1 Tax=Candidatus Macondimonas diazotrophica TaxID=2305248 RepID=A0A4Z0F6S1_9GAMM|nr:nitrogen fixation protein NifZ [Candidatus Macondimonas diazotrophica]MDY6956900.1 nitrogen fixation protein NifZ [Pseudomonadota bacterium]HBG30430.1 nitrogen fixation protein NifZ [Gammaproteobacteria bacterium]NCU01826.1 nitrogen fixation protein NifZ [Candidatus Macondimonas diazotrophica]TFZ81898.1 nitrogen fixation protein NifZ [Candidatus Macondimonas diazotrophica]HBG51097.1 nitrogen fixation protein NifZ [Gammaproteobacteria bacterium]